MHQYNNGHLTRGGAGAGVEQHSGVNINGQMNGSDEAYYANPTIDPANNNPRLSLAMHENQLNNNNGQHHQHHHSLNNKINNGTGGGYYSNVPMNQHLMHSNAMQISPSSSTSSSLSNAEIMSRSQDVTVNEGTSAILSCRLKNYHYSKITWRKSEPESYILRQDEKYDISVTPTGEARLIIKHTRMSDSGVYLCCIENSGHVPNSVPYHLQCSIALVVVPSQNPTALYEPLLTIVDSKTVSIGWNPATTACYVEHCRIGQGVEWRRDTVNPVMPNYEIRNLKPGDSYTFRLTNPATGLIGVASLQLTLPANDVELWQLQHVSVSRKGMEAMDP